MTEAAQHEGYAPLVAPEVTLASLGEQVSHIVLQPGAPR